MFVGFLTGSDIVESNPGKFKLGDNELQERRDFVERTRTSVQVNFHQLKLFFFCCDFSAMSLFVLLCVCVRIVFYEYL